MTRAGACLAAPSQRHLVQLQMIRKSLNIIALESQMAGEACHDPCTEELFQQELDQIVEACLKQKKQQSCSDCMHGVLRQQFHETNEVKIQREAVIDEFDREVVAMQSRIRDLQQQLEQETVNNEAGIAFFEEHIKDLQQQVDEEKNARRVLQMELEMMRSGDAYNADAYNALEILKEQLSQEKKSCQETRRMLQKELSVLQVGRVPKEEAYRAMV